MIVETRGLTKFYGDNPAVYQLDLDVKQGSIHGFLGVNGAGKTTAIRSIMGHIHPTAGEIKVFGVNPWEHDEETKRRVAYVSENMEVPPWMTPERAIRFRSSFYPAWNSKLADELLRDFQLKNAGEFRSLSKGNKRRLCILLAICQNADLLVMDEPAAGLDVVARRELLNRILDIACEGSKTVFFSSHMLSDLERVVDKITIISRGRKSMEGDLDALKNSVREIQVSKGIDEDDFLEYFTVIRYEPEDDFTTVLVCDFDEDRFRTFCEKHQCTTGAQVNGFNLEDLFVELEQNRDALIAASGRSESCIEN